jgi:hypothetical protein
MTGNASVITATTAGSSISTVISRATAFETRTQTTYSCVPINSLNFERITLNTANATLTTYWPIHIAGGSIVTKFILYFRSVAITTSTKRITPQLYSIPINTAGNPPRVPAGAGAVTSLTLAALTFFNIEIPVSSLPAAQALLHYPNRLYLQILLDADPGVFGTGNVFLEGMEAVDAIGSIITTHQV